jgi:hypothetical protein
MMKLWPCRLLYLIQLSAQGSLDACSTQPMSYSLPALQLCTEPSLLLRQALL